MTSRLRSARVALALAAATLGPPVALPSASLTGAGQPSPAGARVETRHLVLTTSASAVRNDRVTLNLDVTLKPKMHVYAPDQPKEQDYLPIALTVASGDAYRLEKPRFPVSEKSFFAPLKETQHVYSKPFRITQALVLTRAIGAAPLTLTGTVRYQACDDAICYVPQTVAVKWEIADNR